MDSTFSFLPSWQARFLNDILTRRNSALLFRIQRCDNVSRSDAQEIMAILSDEFTDDLDDDWEPTEYGRDVNIVLARFNAGRIQEWPEWWIDWGNTLMCLADGIRSMAKTEGGAAGPESLTRRYGLERCPRPRGPIMTSRGSCSMIATSKAWSQ